MLRSYNLKELSAKTTGMYEGSHLNCCTVVYLKYKCTTFINSDVIINGKGEYDQENIVSGYDQQLPQSQAAGKPVTS